MIGAVGARRSRDRSDPILLAVALAGLFHLPVGGQRATSHPQPDPVQAGEAFERLKGLAGEWEGRAADARTGVTFYENRIFEYRVTGGGTVLTERAYAGTPEEMLSVFFMDGDRLLLQHYCSAGNQPAMVLTKVSPGELVFDFVAGRNLDPALDGHIHRVRFRFSPEGKVESLWSWYEEGEEHHVARRVLRERR